MHLTPRREPNARVQTVDTYFAIFGSAFARSDVRLRTARSLCRLTGCKHLEPKIKEALVGELAKDLTKIPSDKILGHLHGVLPI
jgi:hypothetical protein